VALLHFAVDAFFRTVVCKKNARHINCHYASGERSYLCVFYSRTKRPAGVIKTIKLLNWVLKKWQTGRVTEQWGARRWRDVRNNLQNTSRAKAAASHFLIYSSCENIQNRIAMHFHSVTQLEQKKPDLI